MTYSDNTSFGSYSVVVRWKPGKCQLSRNKEGRIIVSVVSNAHAFFSLCSFLQKCSQAPGLHNIRNSWEHKILQKQWNKEKQPQWLKHGFWTQHMQNHPSWETSRCLINSWASPLICFLFQPHPFCLYFLESLVEVWLRDREEAKKIIIWHNSSELLCWDIRLIKNHPRVKTLSFE